MPDKRDLLSYDLAKKVPDMRWGFRIETHYGKGTWDGVEEESAKISVLSDQPLTHLSYLRQALANLAEEYGQDAIALTIGTSELC